MSLVKAGKVRQADVPVRRLRPVRGDSGHAHIVFRTRRFRDRHAGCLRDARRRRVVNVHPCFQRGKRLGSRTNLHCRGGDDDGGGAAWRQKGGEGFNSGGARPPCTSRHACVLEPSF